MASNRPFTREQALIGWRANLHARRIEREERWTEIKFLLENGMHPNDVAKHVGVDKEALSRQAYRHEMPEMGRLFAKNRKRKSRAKH